MQRSTCYVRDVQRAKELTLNRRQETGTSPALPPSRVASAPSASSWTNDRIFQRVSGVKEAVMSRSNARRLTAVELALLTAVLAVVAIEGQTLPPKDTRPWTPLRTPWGDPRHPNFN